MIIIIKIYYGIKNQKEYKNYKRNHNQEESIPNGPFTHQEVVNTINSTKLNTASGHDYVHQKLIYYARDIIYPFLTVLWNIVFYLHATAPTEWKYADISAIPKPGRDNLIVKNNRPISLLPFLARLLEKALANQLITHLQLPNTPSIAHWNGAFQSNKGTEDILLALSKTCFQNFENKTITEVSFKDLQSAYINLVTITLFTTTTIKYCKVQ